MIRALLGSETTTKCRTIDKVDIFGDSSGVALYQLDGNANDTGGNYHGTETAVTYGGGVYERGAVFNGSTSGINILASYISNASDNTAFSFSCNFKFNTLPNATYFQSLIGTSANNGPVFGVLLRYVSAGVFSIEVNRGYSGLVYYGSVNPTVSLSSGIFYTLTVVYSIGKLVTIYLNGSLVASNVSLNTSGAATTINQVLTLGQYNNSGAYNAYAFNGMLDQVRILNRAITATEVATLYAECAPTSIVDNINPFMDGSMKALYKFDGDATDATGVYNGTATNVTYGTGKFGQAGIFDGTSSKVTTTGLTLTTEHSISTWFKTSTATDKILCGTNDASGWNGIYVGMVVTSGVIAYRYYLGGYAFNIASTKNYADSILHHVVATLSSTKDVRLYIDGTLVASGTSTTYPLNSATSLKIGTGDITGWFWNGSIDQLRIFNKALTPLEVASLYNETTPLEEPMYKLVDPFLDGSGKALYRLDGNALDESGNYNGTATSVTYGAGQFGRCGVFNGSSSYIENTSTISITTITTSVWFKTTSTQRSPLISCGAGGYTHSVELGTATVLYLAFNSGSKYAQPTVTAINDGIWHNLVLVDDGADVRCYLDGNIVPLTIVTGNSRIGTGVRIGRLFQTPEQWANCSIDQARIFNRALTQEEVTKLYIGEQNVL